MHKGGGEEGTRGRGWEGRGGPRHVFAPQRGHTRQPTQRRAYHTHVVAAQVEIGSKT
jgi:hypothetical protein